LYPVESTAFLVTGSLHPMASESRLDFPCEQAGGTGVRSRGLSGRARSRHLCLKLRDRQSRLN
jgi:hypothetical protein